MRILYIFPHPDDESFGPALAMARQVKEGHEVYLLTLTKGEATKQRFKLGVDKEEMGEIREKEMRAVEKVLNLSGMDVLSFPDSGLKDLDPRELEEVVREKIEAIKPEVVVTYAVHGISGFHDHLVGHSVVKNAFIEMKEKGFCKRLALYTVNEDQSKNAGSIKLNFSKEEDIDCEIETGEYEKQKFIEALDCYVSYKEVIEDSNIKEIFGDKVCFEFFQEDFKPPVGDIFEGLR